MTSQMSTAQGTPLPDLVREKLRKVTERLGVKPTAKQLGISENTVTRALAKLGVRNGTALLIEQRLKEVR